MASEGHFRDVELLFLAVLMVKRQHAGIGEAAGHAV
jgi:hypothetical protein